MTPVASDAHAPVRFERGSGIAAWRRIADAIEAERAAGALRPGERLPTEAALAARFGVNRHTVRRALAGLASRGLIRTSQGRGSFVEAGPLPYPIAPRTRFTETVEAAGREASGELLRAAEATADAETASALGLTQGSPVLRLTTLRRADGSPIAFGTSTMPLPRFAGLDRLFAETGSLTAAYAALGVADYARRVTRLTARLATSEEAAALELTPGRIVLALAGINVDGAGAPIQASLSVFSADRVELVIGDDHAVTPPAMATRRRAET